MGAEPSSASASASTASPSGKRSRDPEDEVYLDNLHSHKRYLSEIMAYSLNGLTVGDPLPDNIMESPARSDGMLYLSGHRDDLSLQYSPMSEDSDDARFCEYPTSGTCSPSQPESLSRPTSPVSPYRYQRPLPAVSPSPATSFYPTLTTSSAAAATTTTTATSVASSSSQPRQRGSDTEGRFPSSPSDICHSGDLRRAALLRSVQMRAQPCSYGSGSSSSMDVEDRMCFKSLDEDRECQGEDCSSTRSVLGNEASKSKSRKALDMTDKGYEPNI